MSFQTTVEIVQIAVIIGDKSIVLQLSVRVLSLIAALRTDLLLFECGLVSLSLLDSERFDRLD